MLWVTERVGELGAREGYLSGTLLMWRFRRYPFEKPSFLWP